MKEGDRVRILDHWRGVTGTIEYTPGGGKRWYGVREDGENGRMGAFRSDELELLPSAFVCPSPEERIESLAGVVRALLDRMEVYEQVLLYLLRQDGKEAT
jgi:hypothetical protein